MTQASGGFPRIPQEVIDQVKTSIESLMQHATAAASQGLTAVEEVVASGGHSGDAALVSQQKAVEINADLTQVIAGCNDLAHKLGIAKVQFAQQDADAKARLLSSLNTH